MRRHIVNMAAIAFFDAVCEAGAAFQAAFSCSLVVGIEAVLLPIAREL